ncbi:MAG: glycosyltransferase [Chloroflexi bacterium]|nr:glycosyltransferase [Chloroflexota bacterium]
MPHRELKIAMLSVHSCPIGSLGSKDTGGMSVYVREVADNLGKMGHAVDVFTRVHDSDYAPVSELGSNARLIHLPAGDDFEIDKLALHDYLPDFARNVESFRQSNRLQYDLIFSHYWLSGHVGQLLQQRWCVPHVVMFHTMGAVKNTFAVGEPEPPLRLETERKLANECAFVITATQQEKKALVRYYGVHPERVRIIPCGVNPEVFRPIDKVTAKDRLGLNGHKVILCVGRIEPLKGFDQLLRAISRLPEKQDVRLLIVGGDEQSRNEIARLGALARNLGIENIVEFLGLVKQEELPYYYSAADVCVSPSYYESFGLVSLESLACGTPVVATDVGAARSIIRRGEHAGYVVADNSPDRLAEKIALVLSRANGDPDYVSSVRNSVSRFSWGRTAKQVDRVCQQALADHDAPML